MFPPTKSRFRSAALRGIDFAVEFATLGEYRLPEAPIARATQPRTRRSRPLRPPRPTISIARQATRLAPATAAARRREPALPPAPVATHDAVRTLALAGEGPLGRRGPRTRGGQAPTRPQPCVVADRG